jgi:hypothetical protein
MGEESGVHRVLVGKPEGKRPLGRPWCRWEDNIKMDLQEVGGGCGDWMELAQDRDRWRALVSTVKNLFFFNKIYLQYVNTLTLVPDSTKIVPGQPISRRTLAVRGGHGTTWSGHGRYSSEKMAQKKKHCSVKNLRVP